MSTRRRVQWTLVRTRIGRGANLWDHRRVLDLIHLGGCGFVSRVTLLLGVVNVYLDVWNQGVVDGRSNGVNSR